MFVAVILLIGQQARLGLCHGVFGHRLGDDVLEQAEDGMGAVGRLHAIGNIKDAPGEVNILKAIPADFHIVDVCGKEMNLTQRKAVVKSMLTNALNTGGDGDGGQAGAAFENTTSDALQTLGKGDGFQIGAAFEGVPSDFGHFAGNDDACQSSAALEGVFADECQTVGQEYRFQMSETGKCGIPDFGHAFRDDGGLDETVLDTIDETAVFAGNNLIHTVDI